MRARFRQIRMETKSGQCERGSAGVVEPETARAEPVKSMRRRLFPSHESLMRGFGILKQTRMNSGLGGDRYCRNRQRGRLM